MTVRTSESVAEGHPDKVADAIADAILDACLSENPHAKVAAEVLISGGVVVLAGEVAGASPPFVDVARKTLEEIGYDPDDYTVRVVCQRQAENLVRAVSGGGAGDQGIVYGYAVNESPNLMPLAHNMAVGITTRLASVRKSGCSWLHPDGKSQVSLNCATGLVDDVVVSQCHRVGREASTEEVVRHVLAEILGPRLSPRTTVHVNPPDGTWTHGGPCVDTGVTGRKVQVDTYGGACPHGGGAFSGKDPSKVDRTGAYMARWMARGIVRRGLARRCLVSVAYCFGLEKPVSVSVETWGEANDLALEDACTGLGLGPRDIIERFDLLRPIYRSLASGGHFGRDGVPWEA